MRTLAILVTHKIHPREYFDLSITRGRNSLLAGNRCEEREEGVRKASDGPDRGPFT